LRGLSSNSNSSFLSQILVSFIIFLVSRSLTTKELVSSCWTKLDIYAMSLQDLACLDASQYPPPLLLELDSHIHNCTQLQKNMLPMLRAQWYSLSWGHRICSLDHPNTPRYPAPCWHIGSIQCQPMQGSYWSLQVTPLLSKRNGWVCINAGQQRHWHWPYLIDQLWLGPGSRFQTFS
jgi:hypothetical protein